MIIGTVSHFPYGRFAAALWPIAAIGLLLTIVMISLAYRSEFWTHDRLMDHLPPIHSSKPVMIKSALISLAMVVAFFSGVAPARAAVGAGAAMLLTRRIKCQKVYKEIDWRLLLMFAGLFIVVAGLEKTVFTPELIAAVGRLHLERVWILSAVTVAFQPRQQRSRRDGPEALRGVPARPTTRVAHGCDGFNAGRQLHSHRIGGESHRRAMRAVTRREDQLLGLSENRRAADVDYACGWHLLAVKHKGQASQNRRSAWPPAPLISVRAG